jgi:hypothetical protein
MRVEQIEDPLMQKIRHLDKLVRTRRYAGVVATRGPELDTADNRLPCIVLEVMKSHLAMPRSERTALVLQVAIRNSRLDLQR